MEENRNTNKMAELLFEIGTEELPPGLISSLTNQIKENIKNELNANNILISDNEIKTFNTPRRIAIFITNLPAKQKEETIEIKGPNKQSAFDNSGKPTQAAIGFAKKYNLESKDLIVKKINDVEYVFAVTKAGGKKTIDILSKILPDSINQITGEKFMRWGNHDEKFARPIRWILAILDDEIIKFSFSGVSSDKYSYGHRFLANKKIDIKLPKEYEGLLEKNKVITSREKRKEIINNLVKERAKNIGIISPNNYDSLLDTVTNITEYPGALICSFSKEFQSLPPEIIETVLAKHQKYFVIYDRIEQKIKPDFIVITNGTETENKNTEAIKKGNEKVVRARLNDARFFFEDDLKTPFTYKTRGTKLSKITFQKGLGSMEDKTKRITKLSEYIYNQLGKTKINKDDLITASTLCKLDLTTRMVFELPELQGKIGGIYAEAAKFNKDICTGISEYYNQTSNNLIAVTIGIADKLDNIICLFALGKIPSGSTDPFALRRQAQGIIDSILNHSLNINITALMNYHRNKTVDENLKKLITDKTISLIKTFIKDRLVSTLDYAFGFNKDLINSVCSVGDPLTNISDAKDKIKSLNEYYSLKKDIFIPFLTSAKRLVRIVEPNTNGNLNIKNLTTEYEKQLLSRFNEIEKKQYKSYDDFLYELSTLTDTINTFFDKVLVNDPDPKIKQTRQALLKKGKDLFEKICDFNQIIERG